MDRADQRGVERRIRRIRGQASREEKHIHREEDEVAQHHKGGSAGGQFGFVAIPPAPHAVQQSKGCDDRSEQIDFSRANQCEDRRKEQQKKRNAKKAFRGKRLRDRE